MGETTEQVKRNAFAAWMFWWGAVFGITATLWLPRWTILAGAVGNVAWEAWKLWRAFSRDAAPRPAAPAGARPS